jgi:dienelactone hydrolase
MAWLRPTVSFVVLIALFACASPRSREELHFSGLESPPEQFKGVVTFPKNSSVPVPFVVLIHGTAGVDSRYAFHRPALLAAGIGTLEVDFKTNVFTSGTDRPPIPTFHPWVFGALKALRGHAKIDADRIAVMGFSLGGHLSVSVSSKDVVERWLGPDQPGFAAHVGFYPACRWLGEYFDASGATGAPILIFAGELDAWGDGETCPELAARLNQTQPGVVSVKIYPGVHHGFDRAGSWRVYAPYARDRTGILKWNTEAAYDSRRQAVEFLRQVFSR